VEFSTVEGAQSWIEAQQGWLNFDGSKVSMQYSVPRDQRAFEQPKVLNDWICAKCGVQNFRRREACFKCSGPRTDYDTSNEPTDEVSTHPTNSVLLSGLDALTTEDSVLNTLGPLTKLPLKSVRIGRDPLTNMSRGVCYVEMNSVVDSMFLHNQLLAEPPVIDGRQVEVTYHKQGGPQVVTNTSQNQAAANSAMEAAQWTNKSSSQQHGKKFSDKDIQKMAEYSADLYAKNETERESYVEYYKKYYKEGGDAGAAVAALFGDKKSGKKSYDLGMVTVGGVEYKKYKTPDVSSYQFDETSGYYYDPVSTLYYDANSQYYFNSKTNKFCYWDAQHETFLPAPEGEEKTDDKKVVTKDKVKTAKRIQKDMEKWAKTLNQRKDQSKANIVSTPDNTSSSFQKGAEDIAFQILQRKDDKPDSGLPGLAGYGSEEEEEESANTSVAELKLTDWDKLACLLCKRQFQSKEKLNKHNTLSDLHKQNIIEWRKQNTGEGGQGRSQEGNSFQYRDRAKERRNKFGDDDKPVPNKFKEKYLKALDEVTVTGGGGEASSVPKIGEDNVGNRMLQKMGWKDGLGLGKKNQGRTEIITAQSRTAQSGLGTAQIASNPNDTYKDLARKTLWNRYNNEGGTN